MKTIIITGSSRGIGLATAKKFIDEGWRVIGTYSVNPIRIDSPNLITVRLDQGSSDSIHQAVDQIKKLGLPINGLVNNAAVALDAFESVADVVKIRRTFDVDLFGVIEFTEKLVPSMTTGCHIINMSSSYGSFSFPVNGVNSTGYRLAKAAINMYTRTLAFRLKDKGIVVASLDPGWVKTDMGNSSATEIAKPDCEPEETALDIYNLVTKINETGYFWKFGKKREW